MNRTQEKIYQLNVQYVQTAKEIATADPTNALMLFGLTQELARALVAMPFERIDEFIRLRMPGFEPTVTVTPDLKPRETLRRMALYYARLGTPLLPAGETGSQGSRLQVPPLIERAPTTNTSDRLYRLNYRYLDTLKSIIEIDIQHAVSMFGLTLDVAEAMRDNRLDQLAHLARLDVPLFKPVLRTSGTLQNDFMIQLKSYNRS